MLSWNEDVIDIALISSSQDGDLFYIEPGVVSSALQVQGYVAFIYGFC